MNFNEKKKKFLLYGLIALALILSVVVYKITTSADSGDNKITIKSARITAINTGTGDFTPDNLTEDDNGEIASYTAGGDSSASNRLIRSNDQLSYTIGYTIGGKNDNNQYYSRNVNITVDLSAEEANYVSFDPNTMPGETSHTYTFNNISSTGGEYSSTITLYILNGENGSRISPKFTIKESTDSDTGVILGNNGTAIDYAYENGNYTNTNRSTVENYLPTVVSSTPVQDLRLRIRTAGEGQKAIYDNQVGRYFTGVLEVYTPVTKGTYVASSDLSLPVNVSQMGSGTPQILDNWVRLYNGELVDTIEPVSVEAPYSRGDGKTASNETRYPGIVTYSGGTMTINGIKQTFSSPSVSAANTPLNTSEKILGTYAISLFSPRTAADGKDDISVSLDVGGAGASFSNKYYENSDYNLISGFYDETGNERLTTYVNDKGVIEALPSSTSKGSTIAYKTVFNYNKTLSNSGLKEVIKVDPIAFRVIPQTDKKDLEIKVSCGREECSSISEDDFEIKYISNSWDNANYTVGTVDSRIVPEDAGSAADLCAGLDLSTLNRDQMMNIYGGPCISDNNAKEYEKIIDARNADTDEEDPISKIVVQTKEGVNLPDNATVTVNVKLRVRNVPDITQSYQGGVTISTSDHDSELYYYVPDVNNSLNPNNYIKSTYNGSVALLNTTVPFGDCIRIVNFTARQNLTVTNKLSDGQIKTSYNVDENETIKYNLKTDINDLNEQVGADDVWYFKAVGVHVYIPNTLDYIPDDSLGTPAVDVGSTMTHLYYELPWTKANFKIPEINFKAKLKNTLSGNRVPIVVTTSLDPININGERDMSVFDAKTGSFTIYGTGSNTVLLSQSNEGKTVVDKDAEFTYLLHAYNNSSDKVDNYVITDILPYNGDSRGSEFNGSYEVKVTIPSTQASAKLYCSTKDPKTYSGESNNSEDEFEECSTQDFVKATAIRVTGIKLNNGDTTVDGYPPKTMDPIKVTIKPSNNKFGDKYGNDFVGGNRELKDRKSNEIDFNVISRTISGRVFKDANEDGIRNEGEQLVSGLTASLYKVEDGKLTEVGKTSETDKNGEYKFTKLDPGFYKVRIEYSNGEYDLALRYASENRAIDSDAYKIKDGLAEISEKHEPGTIDGIDLSVFDNYKAEDMDMGLIPRVSFGFEMKKYITQVDLNYNNSINTTKYNNQSTVALNVRNTLNATAKVYYGIMIRNNSTQAGYVKDIQEDIPDGLIFDASDPYNKDWFQVDGALKTNVLEEKVFEPGDTAYLQIALNMPNRESGNTFINTVSIIDIEPYIPQELAKEAEFESDSYSPGDEVSYAGVNWHVVSSVPGEDNDEIVTLLADHGTISGTKANSNSGIYKWSDSPIRTYINNDWLNTNSINAPILKDQAICNDSSSFEGNSFGGTLASAGTCTSNEFVTDKVRLLTVEEYNSLSNLSDKSWIYVEDFWLMNSVNTNIIHNIYGVQTDTTVNNLGNYAAAVSGSNTSVATDQASHKKEVRPVITISSKNIIGQ